MAPSNLQEVLDAAGNTVEHLRNSQLGTYIYPVVPAEFSNWRREQKAWRETAVLYDQSHHMVNVFLKGPDAIKVIERTAINSVANFPVGRGQAVHPDRLERRRHRRRHPLPRRRGQLHLRRTRAGLQLAQIPRRDGRLQRPRRRLRRPLTLAPLRQRRSRRRLWRFEIQGPNAWPVIEKLNGGPVEQLKFFHMATMKIAGETYPTLRHGMAGAPGPGDLGPV